jgi:MSHA biogenesis protein MshO
MRPIFRSTYQGFTLVELVVVMALTAVVLSFGVSFIAAPVQTLERAGDRAVARHESSTAILDWQREMRAALPGSLRYHRNGSIVAIEIMHVIAVSTALPDALAGSAAAKLDVASPDGSFETLGNFPGQVLPVNTRILSLAVYDPTAGSNPYAGASHITPPNTLIQLAAGSAADQTHVTLTPAVQFSTIGAQRKLFLLDGPVTYLCDPTGGTLRRYTSYTPDANPLRTDSDIELRAAGASVALLANGVSNCDARSLTTVSANQSVAELTLTLTRGGEQGVLSTTVVIDNVG